MNDVVTYYCGGKKPVLELLVSIYSLRQFYNGNITVCLGKTSIPYLKPLIDSKEVTICIVPRTDNDKTNKQHWRSRWMGMAMINGNRILHPDCDIVFYKNPEKLLELISTKSDYITTFHSINDGRIYDQWPKHLNEYRKIDPNFNETPLYIEFGILGWYGPWPYCIDVSKVCEVVKDDQTAMSYVLMKNGRKAYCPNTKYKLMKRARAYHKLKDDDYYATVAWHSHPAYELWWRVAVQAIKENFMNLGNMAYLKKISRKNFKLYKYGNYPSINYKEI